jgi:hypothetical protein
MTYSNMTKNKVAYDHYILWKARVEVMRPVVKIFARTRA